MFVCTLIAHNTYATNCREQYCTSLPNLVVERNLYLAILHVGRNASSKNQTSFFARELNLIVAQSADIDVVGISDIDKKAVIGECKFKNEKIDKGIYETLVRRGKVLAAKYKVSKYIFFSLSGYTEWVENLKDKDILLLTLDSLYE